MSALHDAWKQRAATQRGMADAGGPGGESLQRKPSHAQPDAASRTPTSMDRSCDTILRVCEQEQERMRRAGKVDANQSEIVDALRAVGALVHITASAGNGFPDLVVGHRGKLALIECKDGALPPSARLLTPEQKRFHATWFGYCYVANSPADALAIIGLGPKQAA